MHESFLKYNHFFYLKVAVIMTAISVVAYVVHEPLGSPSGGTWLGYTLGSIGAFIILFLLWFGVRKRQFSSTKGQVKEWLSAHVYLGAALIPIVTLHSGGQLGWNVHTLAYVLMVLVVLSGFYGIYVYVRYPNLITNNLGDLKRKGMLDEIELIDSECIKSAYETDVKVHEIILHGIKQTKIGGTVWQQITRNTLEQSPVEFLLDIFRKIFMTPLSSIKDNSVEQTTAFVMADTLSSMKDTDKMKSMHELLSMLNRKESLVDKVNKDIQYKALMQIWLYFHVPLSIALLAALVTHIIVVFFYW